MASRRRPPRPTAPAELGLAALDLASLTLEEEIEHKRRRVERALRARGLEHPVPPPRPSPLREGARARISLRVSDTGALVVHEPGSHRQAAAPVETMARAELAAVARAVEARAQAQPELLRRVERLEFRSDGQRVVTVLHGNPPKPAQASLLELLRPALGADGALCVGERCLHGPPRLAIPLGEIELEVGPLTFFQVNLEVNRSLVAAVGRAVDALEPTRVLDLFGGAGNLSLPLAARGHAVEIVESSASAVRDARANARRLGVDLTACQEDAYRLQAGSRFFDVALLDPPRKGAGPALEAACATRPRGLVLVSCHTASLARDLERALASGYQLDTLELFDLFPLTSHVESVAVLTRR
jgi:23S rRNA (uracil1939-C5)-methyltransferase